jgi:hypothetical protein
MRNRDYKWESAPAHHGTLIYFISAASKNRQDSPRACRTTHTRGAKRRGHMPESHGEKNLVTRDPYCDPLNAAMQSL